MASKHTRLDPNAWWQHARFSANIMSLRQMNVINDSNDIPIYLDTVSPVRPEIKLSGTQSKALSVWETRSQSGFITKPKFSTDLVTIRFVTSGHIAYSCRNGEISASPTIAALTEFDDLLES